MGRRRRIVIVANRLPVQRSRTEDGGSKWKPSPGGLVTALEPVLKQSEGVWVGWTGTPGLAPRPFTLDGVMMRPVSMSEAEENGFYHGLSNSTLWPLYHDAIRTPDFVHEWWEPYVEVNRRFARTAAAEAARNGIVWVHDYQLQLVPGMLREMRPDLRIGFFIHIPFPPEELFAWLPWRKQILEGLLGADVVGFQTHQGAQNFSRAAREYTDAEGTDALLTYQGREVRVSSFPISIDAAWFQKAAETEEVAKEAMNIRRRVGANRKILLCVDRLDYTKGIDMRLDAYGELLRRRVASIDDCVLMQIAVPTRESVFEYADMRRRIEQLVGQINGDFSEPGRVAVHFFRRSFSREDLVAFYKAADVMLVTPLRDGMNLVAKEYVACRTDNTGVLVLSEFAGAARELRRALLVNPRDREGMVSAMTTAVRMSKEAARMRMAILRTQVKRHDVHDWAASFLEALES